VGKKPPQSQKGGSFGLTPRMSAGLSPKEQKIKKRNKIKIKVKIKIMLVPGDLVELRQAACAQDDNQKLKLKKLFFFFSGRKRPRQAPRGRLRLAGEPKIVKIIIILYFFYFFVFFFAPYGLAPRTSTGLSHGSPSFYFEVDFCPPPNS
jgi:hypothetical protein